MTKSSKDPVRRATRGAPLAAWEEQVHSAHPDSGRPDSREEALALKRQEAGLLRADELVHQLLAEGGSHASGRTVVLVHRRPWFIERLASLFDEAGVKVVGTATDGSKGFACAVVAQPTLVVLEDSLPWMTSLELVQSSRKFAPRTKLVVHADSLAMGNACVEAGARAAYSRRVSLTDLRAHCLTLLEAG